MARNKMIAGEMASALEALAVAKGRRVHHRAEVEVGGVRWWSIKPVKPLYLGDPNARRFEKAADGSAVMLFASTVARSGCFTAGRAVQIGCYLDLRVRLCFDGHKSAAERIRAGSIAQAEAIAKAREFFKSGTKAKGLRSRLYWKVYGLATFGRRFKSFEAVVKYVEANHEKQVRKELAEFARKFGVQK